MSAVITDGDIAYLRSQYPDLNLKQPSGQEEHLLLLHLRGQTVAAAAHAVGYSSVQRATKFVNSPTGQKLLQLLRDREFQDVRVTRDSLTSMFLSAYHSAATASEMVMAARELGKLHGLYPEAQKGNQINIMAGGDVNVSTKKLQSMSAEELAKLAEPELKRVEVVSEERNP